MRRLPLSRYDLKQKGEYRKGNKSEEPRPEQLRSARSGGLTICATSGSRKAWQGGIHDSTFVGPSSRGQGDKHSKVLRKARASRKQGMKFPQMDSEKTSPAHCHVDIL